MCCGGLPLYATTGLGTIFAGLRIWRFLPPIVGAGMLVIVAISWWFCRRKTTRGMPPGPARRAMLVNAGIGLAVMAAAVFGPDRLEHAGVIDVEHVHPGTSAESHPGAEAEHQGHEGGHGEEPGRGEGESSMGEPEGTGTGAFIMALTGVPFGLGLAGLLPLAPVPPAAGRQPSSARAVPPCPTGRCTSPR